MIDSRRQPLVKPFKSAQSSQRKIPTMKVASSQMSEELKEGDYTNSGDEDIQGSNEGIIRQRQQMCKMNQKDSRNSTLPSPLTDSG